MSWLCYSNGNGGGCHGNCRDAVVMSMVVNVVAAVFMVTFLSNLSNGGGSVVMVNMEGLLSWLRW